MAKTSKKSTFNSELAKLVEATESEENEFFLDKVLEDKIEVEVEKDLKKEVHKKFDKFGEK